MWLCTHDALLWAVGVSRLYFGYHYFSDVVGGLGMAFAIVFLGVDRLAGRWSTVVTEPLTPAQQ